MSRRIVRTFIAATVAGLMLGGLPPAAIADVSTYPGAGPGDLSVRMTGPTGLAVIGSPTSQAVPNTDGTEYSVPITNNTRQPISVKVTDLRFVFSNGTTSIPFVASEFFSKVIIVPSNTTITRALGVFDYPTILKMVGIQMSSQNWPETRLEFTLSEVSTLNWAPLRAKLSAAGFEPGVRGNHVYSTVDAAGVSTVYTPTGVQFPVCNRNAYPRLLRIKNVTFGGTEVPAGVGVYQILPNDCVNLYLGDPASLFGQTNLAIDAVIGDDFEFDYTAFDDAMAPLHIRRAGKAVVIPDALAVGSQAAPNAKAYVPVCSDLASAITPVNTVTGLSWVTGGNVLIDSNTTKPKTIITALCNEGETTNWPLPDIATDGYAATIDYPDSPLRLNLTVLGQTPYIVSPRLTEASKYDWSDVYAQLTSLGFRSLNNGMMIGDPNDNTKRLLMTNACNSTSSTKYVRVKAATVGDASYVYDQPYVRAIAAGECATVTVGQTNPLPLSYNGAKLTVLFGPEYMFDTSSQGDSQGIDEALFKAGLKRVGDITVDVDPDDVNKQIVEVPVCTRGKKERSIYVGYALVGVGRSVWGARNDEIQKISGMCPAGGNTLLYGSFSSVERPLEATAGTFLTQAPQLVAAIASTFSTSSLALPAGVTLTATPAMAKFSASGQSNNGTTEIWADVNVPLAKKAKTYTLGNLTLGHTAISAITIKGACKTVKVGKTQMCQRRVKLGTLDGNWLYGKVLNIAGVVS